jgi:hypothetical protein
MLKDFGKNRLRFGGNHMTWLPVLICVLVPVTVS